MMFFFSYATAYSCTDVVLPRSTYVCRSQSKLSLSRFPPASFGRHLRSFGMHLMTLPGVKVISSEFSGKRIHHFIAFWKIHLIVRGIIVLNFDFSWNQEGIPHARVLLFRWLPDRLSNTSCAKKNEKVRTLADNCDHLAGFQVLFAVQPSGRRRSWGGEKLLRKVPKRRVMK